MTEQISKSQLLHHIEVGWHDLQTYIAGLNETQLTQPTDLAGWTVKDHLFHLSVWQDAMADMLQGGSRWAQLGLPPETAPDTDYDQMNAVIQQANQAKTIAEVKQALADAHAHMLHTLQPLSDDDLYRPYNDYVSDPNRADAVILWIAGYSHEHYAQHIPWMDAIIKEIK